MKKLFILILALCGITSSNIFAQVTKADFETTMTQSGATKFTKIYLYNVKTFYTDGTNKSSYLVYEGEKTIHELGTTSISLKYYTDNTKSSLGGITTIPYASIKYFIIGSNELEIFLKD